MNIKKQDRKEYDKKYYLKNKEKFKERSRLRNKTHKEDIRLKSRIRREKNWKEDPLHMCFDSGKRRAKSRGIPWLLSEEEYLSIRTLDSVCSKCSEALPERGHGLDRIDSKGCYEIDNVQLLCIKCNKQKAYQLGEHLGDRKPKNYRKLSEKDKLEIAEKKQTIKEQMEKYNTSRTTIIKARRYKAK